MRKLIKMPSDLLELIILAVITGFLIFKLYTTLGQKVGFEPSPDTKPLKPSESPESKTRTSYEEDIVPSLSPSLKTVIEEIRRYDSQFDLKSFLKGATQAFEIILEAFAKGDIKTLKDLLGPEVFDEFKANIEEREKNSEVLDATLVKIESVELTDGKVEQQKAHLTVTFQSEQIYVTRDHRGQIIDGHPQQIEQLIDTWIFERLLSSRNPNWTLIKTVV